MTIFLSVGADETIDNNSKDRNGNTVFSTSNGGSRHSVRTPILTIAVLFLSAVVSCLAFGRFTYPFLYLSSSFRFMSPFPIINATSPDNYDLSLAGILKRASTEDKTVILTTLNQAWAEPGSIMDLFLESFKNGNNISGLVNNLVIINMDQKAYDYCLAIHPHCYAVNTTGFNFSSEAYFMTPVYLEMMWARIDLLASVLELGYNFVFTDADIMWLQDPFLHFYPDADFQIACDTYNGRPFDRNNDPNGGFNYVKSNKRTIQFYKFWYSSRKNYTGKHDQDVLNMIKFHPFIDNIGLQMRFLDTAYYGGFCQLSRDFNKVCTMHANCCFGLDRKVYDLRLVLQDWKRFMSSPPNVKASSSFTWRVPRKCRIRGYHPPNLPQKKGGND